MMITDQARTNILQLFSYLGISEDKVVITEEAPELIKIDVNLDEHEAGVYIGRFASMLDSLQLVISLFLSQLEPRPHVLLDIGGYRVRRQDTLRAIADRLSQEVEETGEARAFPPISATERRQVHLMFKDHATLTTFSQGEGYDRRLFIGKKLD